MTVRNDLTIDWSPSPRLITVDAPSDEVSMQDLLDTLRTAEVNQMDEPQIVDASGKETLGEGLAVGLTITLLNAKLAFEARSSTPYILCRAWGGNLVAVDEYGDPFDSPIHPTAYTTVTVAASSSATLQEQDPLQYEGFFDDNYIEEGLSFRQAQRLLAAAAAGKVSGADGTTIVIRNAMQDSKNRITATVDEYGNRTAVTYDVE